MQEFNMIYVNIIENMKLQYEFAQSSNYEILVKITDR